MTRIKIEATGSYLPERIVTNEELAEKLPATSDEWIVQRTGIKSRHLAGPDESPVSMGVQAARQALDMAGMTPDELGFIIISSTSFDYGPIPLTSGLIQRELGATSAACFDLSSACCGFIFGLEIARNLFNNPFHQKPILVISTEMMSRKVDWNNHQTCVLFGDGAGAAILTPSDSESGIIDTYMRTDGTGADCMRIEGGSRLPPELAEASPHYLWMEGKKVFTFAVKAMPDVLAQLLERNHLKMEEIKKIVPHQANYRIIKAAGERFGLSDDAFYLNIDRVANTASASIPIALDEMNRAGQLQRGDKIITASFGAGLSYGGNYIIW